VEEHFSEFSPGLSIVEFQLGKYISKALADSLIFRTQVVGGFTEVKHALSFESHCELFFFQGLATLIFDPEDKILLSGCIFYSVLKLSLFLGKPLIGSIHPHIAHIIKVPLILVLLYVFRVDHWG
jgi:hypothetical protein